MTAAGSSKCMDIVEHVQTTVHLIMSDSKLPLLVRNPSAGIIVYSVALGDCRAEPVPQLASASIIITGSIADPLLSTHTMPETGQRPLICLTVARGSGLIALRQPGSCCHSTISLRVLQKPRD